MSEEDVVPEVRQMYVDGRWVDASGGARLVGRL